MAGIREQLTAVELLSCGAAAGATGKTLLAPVDRVKLMYMTSSRRSVSISEAAATALEGEVGRTRQALRAESGAGGDAMRAGRPAHARPRPATSDTSTAPPTDASPRLAHVGFSAKTRSRRFLRAPSTRCRRCRT